MQTSTTPSAPRPAAEDRRWLRAFTPLTHEHPFEWLRVEGAIPEGLLGTVFFNGPAAFEAFGRPHGHWFDGDGAVAAVRFRPGRVHGAVRFTDTLGRRVEHALKRGVFGAYGTPMKWPLVALPPTKRVKNSANTAILCHEGRLFALFEGGKPTALDPWSLDTIGEDDFGGVVRRGYTAHPTRLPDGRVLGYGLRIGKDDFLDLYERRGMTNRRIGALPLEQPTMVHDFAATDRHLVFFLSPVELDKTRTLLGRGSFDENLAWKPERGAEIVVVPIDAPDRPIRWSVDPFFQWHFANAFERTGEIVVDFVRYDDFASDAWLRDVPRGTQSESGGGQPCRAVLDPKARKATFETTHDGLAEFPIVDRRFRARSTRLMFAGGSASGRMARPIDRLLKIDVDKGTAAPFALGDEQLPCEPVFVPRPGGHAEGDGWLLTCVYDATRHESYVAVLDAKNPSAAPLARAYFPGHVPPRFHGDWLPG